MRRIASAGALTLALTLGACAGQQPPAPPPLNLVTEAPSQPEAAPAPPTAAQLLAQQPCEVQAAIKEHQQDSKWPVYKTPELVLYPYGEDPEPIVDCQPLRTTDIEHSPAPTRTDVIK